MAQKMENEPGLVQEIETISEGIKDILQTPTRDNIRRENLIFGIIGFLYSMLAALIVVAVL